MFPLAFPFYVKVKTKGFNPLNPTLANGTMLGEGLLGLVPITVVYHFNQFGALQPYLGAGLAPCFSFGNKNDFLTGIRFGGFGRRACCRPAPIT